MAKFIEVGDKVQMNGNAGGIGARLYAFGGIYPNTTYTVTGIRYDANPNFNKEYGGYLILDGDDSGFVMEDFSVVEAE